VDPFSFPPLAFLLDLAATGLWQLQTLLEPVTGGFAAVASVLVVTLLVRAVLVPVGVAQARAERDRARLAPRLRLLQQRHGRDRERLQRETMKLYRDEGVSPVAGCLPLLLQAPVVGLLYAVFLHPVIAGAPNALLAETLMTVPLGASLAGSVAAGALDATAAAVFGGIVAVIALVGELTRRAFRPPAPQPGTPAVPGALLGAAQFAAAVVALFVPLAAALYLVVTVVWTLVQRLVLRRLVR
jgi:YidC/Oxa1 family membrane protein insertase